MPSSFYWKHKILDAIRAFMGIGSVGGVIEVDEVSSEMELLKNQCRELYPSKKINLEVRSFNERAIKCYKKAGFKVKEIYKRDTPLGYGEFIRMEYNY